MNRQNTSHHIPQRSTIKHNVSSNNINTSLNLSSINNLNSVSNARLKEITQATNLSVCLPPSSSDKSPVSRIKDTKTKASKENITHKTPPPPSKKNDSKQQQILKGVLKSSYTKLSNQAKPSQNHLQRLKFEKSCAIIIEPLKNKDSNRISHLYSFSHRRDSASSKTRKEEISGNNHKSTSRILQHNNPVKPSLGPVPTKSFFSLKSETKTLSQILRKSQERINTLKNEKVLEELESQQNESSFFSMNYQYRRQSMGDADVSKFEPTQNKRLSVPTLMTQEFETENTRCKTYYDFAAKDEGLYRANLFGEKLNGLLKGLILKQKMGFFMKLRENMHLYQWKLSKFAKAQEAKKKGFYFRTWEKFIRVKKNKFPCASARLNKTTFENPKTTAAESQKLTLKKLLDKNMQSLHLNLSKILEDGAESNPVNKSIELPKEQSRFYAKRGSAPDVSMFDLKLSSNNNFAAASHSQSVIFNPAAFKDSDICNNSLESSFASISEKNFKSQQNNLLRKSEDLLSFKQSQASNEEQHSLGINLSSFNKDCESHNTSMTDQILTNIPQPVQRDGLDISAYDSFTSKEKAPIQKKPTSTLTSKISQPKIKQNIATVNKDKSKSYKRPENVLDQQMKQDLEKKIQQRMSATKVVKKTRNESFMRNNESQETDISIRKETKQPVPMPKKKTQGKSVVKFEKILPQPEQPETKVLQKSFEKKIEEAIIESNHHIIINNEKALQFRKIKLIQTYFNRLLLTTQLVINRKNEAAEYLQIRNLLKKGFIGLSTGSMSVVAPENEISFSNQPFFGSENHQNQSMKEEEELEIKMQIAENYYECTTKMNVFDILLKNSQEKNKSYDEYRKGYLMRACFVKWFENKSLLKGEEGTEEHPDVFAYEGELPTFRSINNENEEKIEKEFE